MAFDRDRDAEPRPREPRRRGVFVLGFTTRMVGAATMIGVLVLLAHETGRPRQPTPTISDLSVVTPGFGISAPPMPPGRAMGRLRLEDDGIDPVRAEPGGDTISRGDFSAMEASYLRITLAQDAAGSAPSLFVTLARRAAEGPNLAVVRTGERRRIDTKFGPVETLEATLAGPMSRICTGFVTRAAMPLRLDGWLCAPLGQPPEPRTLACVLDALALDGSTDPAATAPFVEGERHDPTCDRRRTVSATDPTSRTGSIARRRSAADRRMANR